MDFTADGSILVSKNACMVNCVLENLLKLHVHAVKSVMEWCANVDLHHDCLLKQGEFYDFPKNVVDCLSWMLSIGLELKTLIWQMCCLVSDKFDAIYNDVAQHIGALDLVDT